MLRRILATALLGFAVLPAAGEDKPKAKSESFQATVVGGANMRLPGGNTMTLTMTVEKWTTPDEVRALLAILREKGK
ncbi:MAG TPA: hypothetical protein VMN04_06570, partial [Thermoanaerobaculia bacterium]|nr:hypothetical protein [Thermoanaerobaculia bacterium]